MKLHSIFSRCIIPLVMASSLLVLPVVAQDEAEEQESPLYESMDEANKALKSLRKIEEGDWAAGASAARAAAAGILKGVIHIPVLVTEMPEGKEKEVALADYRRLMGLSYASLCELELAYLSEDQAVVDEVRAKVKEIKKEGHKKYED